MNSNIKPTSSHVFNSFRRREFAHEANDFWRFPIIPPSWISTRIPRLQTDFKYVRHREFPHGIHDLIDFQRPWPSWMWLWKLRFNMCCKNTAIFDLQIEATDSPGQCSTAIVHGLSIDLRNVAFVLQTSTATCFRISRGRIGSAFIALAFRPSV